MSEKIYFLREMGLLLKEYIDMSNKVVKDNNSKKHNERLVDKIKSLEAELYNKSICIKELKIELEDLKGMVKENDGRDHILRTIKNMDEIIAEEIKMGDQDALTGWKEENGKHIFITANKVITANGVLESNNGTKSKLTGSLKHYSLPSPPKKSEKVKEAVAKSLEFLDIAPLTVTAPIWAAMYLAPLNPFFRQDFIIWINGLKACNLGTEAPTLLKLALSHFGDFIKNPLPSSWKDSSYKLNAMIHLAKDVPFAIDGPRIAKLTRYDRKKGISLLTNEAKKFRNKMGGVIRSISKNRGLVLSTGYPLPCEKGIMDNILFVDMNPNEYNGLRNSDSKLSYTGGRIQLY
jgi:hypothetical protein